MTLTSRISRVVLVSLGILVGAVATLYGQQNALNLMPEPAQLTPGQGRLPIDGNFRVGLAGYEEPRLQAAAERLISRLARQTGILLADGLAPDASQATLLIECDHAGEAVQSFKEDESYTLEVSPKQARLQAPTPVGALRGMETFLQLVDLDATGFGVPAVEIHDQPRFPWRGLMMDVSRHWMPIEVVERNLDGMAAVKLNVFHWHLVGRPGISRRKQGVSQAARIGVGRALLHAGASEGGHRLRARPGHSRGAGIRYARATPPRGSWDIRNSRARRDLTRSSATGASSIRRWTPRARRLYRFLDAFIGEMAALFPDEYFHVGGDEVNGKQWKRNPRIQAFMREHAMKDAADLQAYFSARLWTLVVKHGKKTIGWDEVLHPGVPKNIVGSLARAGVARSGRAPGLHG